MTTDQKIKILELDPEAGMPGDESDVRAFFASNGAKYYAAYLEKVLSEKVDCGSVPDIKIGSSVAEYEIVKGCGNYGQTMYVVKNGNEKFPGKGKALTALETMKALVSKYKSCHDEKDNETSRDWRPFFESYLDTLTAFAYKAGSNNFKIVPRSSDLENIAENFSQSSINKDYKSIDAPELNRTKAEYNVDLTEEEVPKHEGWLMIAEGDVNTLKEFAHIAFKEYISSTKSGKGMSIYLRDKNDIKHDSVRSLVLGYGCYYDFNADGGSDLDDDARLLRINETK